MIWLIILLITLTIVYVVGLYHLWKYYKRRLHQEMRRAQKSEQLKTVFLANVSHALRTPLNSIIGFSDLLLSEEMEGIPQEQTKEMVTHINQNGKQLLHFISQLLELSNFEGSMLTFTKIEVNLAELMASYRREILRDTNPNVAVRIHTQLSPHCKVTLDTNLMHQLIMRLLSNAARHTKQGSITINYAHERKGLAVSIIDTGSGLPEKYKEHIFSMLENEDAMTLLNQGSGLGLSICKSIVDALSGEISLTSEEGKGTTATFWFPCRMVNMNKGL